MKKYCYIYKITCLCGSLKDHYYIGQHTTNNLNDNYTGSGRIISDYFKHYEKIEGETYYKEILCFCDKSELNDLERYYINNKNVTDNLCINLRSGGGQNTNLCDESKRLISERAKYYWDNHPETKEYMRQCHLGKELPTKGRPLSSEHRKKLSENHYDCSGENNPMYGKNFLDYMTEEAKQERALKISKANKGKNVGEKNGMYGRHTKDIMTEEIYLARNKKISDSRQNQKYMNKDGVIKSVHINDIEYYKSIGWSLGRGKKAA